MRNPGTPGPYAVPLTALPARGAPARGRALCAGQAEALPARTRPRIPPAPSRRSVGEEPPSPSRPSRPRAPSLTPRAPQALGRRFPGYRGGGGGGGWRRDVPTHLRAYVRDALRSARPAEHARWQRLKPREEGDRTGQRRERPGPPSPANPGGGGARLLPQRRGLRVLLPTAHACIPTHTCAHAARAAAAGSPQCACSPLRKARRLRRLRPRRALNGGRGPGLSGGAAA